MSDELRRTALYEEHLRLDGKMVPFAGFSLPVQYPSGIRAEHRAVRQAAGMFDVSHMGEVEVTGPEAVAFLQQVTVNDISALVDGKAQYSLFCNEAGGVVDDLLVSRIEGARHLLVVNAANHDRDLEWLRDLAAGFDVVLADRSDDTALIAVQGPRAHEVLSRTTDTAISELRSFRLAEACVAGRRATVSRTGYTGEDGFEIFTSPEDAASVWRRLLDEGREVGLLPCGLGARDTLRIEAGLPLHGAELDEEHTPIEAGLGWVVKLEKGDFLGREALRAQAEGGVDRRRVGLRLEDRGFPRPGYPVVSAGEEVGSVTSGTVSPGLDAGIAMAYVPEGLSAEGTSLAIAVRGNEIPARVVSLPFVPRGRPRP